MSPITAAELFAVALVNSKVENKGDVLLLINAAAEALKVNKKAFVGLIENMSSLNKP